MPSTDGPEIHHDSSEVSFDSPRQGLLTITLSLSGSVRVVHDHGAEEASELDLLTTPPCWALSLLDWQAHAIDAWADQPVEVWIARCGHRLSGGTPLYDVPQWQRCASCARWSPATKAVSRR